VCSRLLRVYPPCAPSAPHAAVPAAHHTRNELARAAPLGPAAGPASEQLGRGGQLGGEGAEDPGLVFVR
jgi:hypothetical protein